MRTRSEARTSAKKLAKNAVEEIGQAMDAVVQGLSDRSDNVIIPPPDVPPPPESKPDVKPPENPFHFPNANRAKSARLREDLAKVVETIYVKDIHDDWKKLETGLSLGEKRSEHAHAIAALDKAASRAYLAHRLYLTARSVREEWELENEVIFGAMWSAATRDLQKEKDGGLRSKQITDADVKSRVATMFPDEYQAQEKRRRDVEFTVKSLERLAEIWMSKCRDLQAMVGKLR